MPSSTSNIYIYIYIYLNQGAVGRKFQVTVYFVINKEAIYSERSTERPTVRVPFPKYIVQELRLDGPDNDSAVHAARCKVN